MKEVLTALERLSTSVAKLTSIVEAFQPKLVPPAKVVPIARSIATTYFGSIHSQLQTVQHRAGLSEEFEFAVSAILRLSSEPRDRRAYTRQITELRGYVQEAMIDVMKASGARRLVLSDTERRIFTTLAKMLPTTASSYEQVLHDLAIGGRVSWRGTGTELREVLREVMDHLAPDGDVMAVPGFKLEAELTRPTQKQKVRFILKARRKAVGVAEDAIERVEEGVASLARSTYKRSSVTTHTTTDAAEVRKLKNYVDALLVELLEILA